MGDIGKEVLPHRGHLLELLMVATLYALNVEVEAKEAQQEQCEDRKGDVLYTSLCTLMLERDLRFIHLPVLDVALDVETSVLHPIELVHI